MRYSIGTTCYGQPSNGASTLGRPDHVQNTHAEDPIPWNPSFRSSPCLSRRALGAGAVAALLASGTARAASLRVSIAEMPDPVVTESLVQAIRFAAAKDTGVSIEVTTTSFPRSIQNVIDGAADIHLPMIRVPHPETLAFDLSTAAMGIVPFVLYMNKNKPVDIALVRKGGKYEIESETASTGYWDFA